jgi:RNA polymerase sigma-70 factor (ECF subfamily)
MPKLDITDPVDVPAFQPSKPDLAVVDGLKPLADDDRDVAASEDWHVHLADALSSDDKAMPAAGAAPATTDALTRDDRLQDEPSQIVPLSSTLANLAVETELEQGEEGEDVLVPPLSIKPQDRSTVAAQPPMAAPVAPAFPVTLSPEQTALSIIAQVPRLRRFAAAQIGDDNEADRLVRATIQSVLADPTVLDQAEDRNLALLMMLCRKRQGDLSGAARSARSAAAAKAFQTTLCEKLVGADQFEIHQFAQAINLVNEQDRTLLVLAALEGLSYEQIAGMVQRPVGQVMLRLAEARMGLRQALNAEEGGDAASAETHPREIEIHGYLDGELDQRHMAEMDSLVEHDQDAADRLLHYGIQGDLIRRIYAPLLNRPIPHDMLVTFSTAFSAKTEGAVKRGFFRGARLALFAGALVMALGAGIATWMVPSLASAVSDAMTVSSPTPLHSTEPGEPQAVAAATALGQQN